MVDSEQLWKAVIDFYWDTFHITEDLVISEAGIYIARASMSGYSNERIAHAFKIDKESVSFILKEMLGFSGFEEDYPVNLISVYLNEATRESLRSENEILYNAVERYFRVKELLDEKWI